MKKKAIRSPFLEKKVGIAGMYGKKLGDKIFRGSLWKK